jgi:hypothetical protein
MYIVQEVGHGRQAGKMSAESKAPLSKGKQAGRYVSTGSIQKALKKAVRLAGSKKKN